MKEDTQDLFFDSVEAPAGAPFRGLTVVADGVELCAVDFFGYEERMHRLLARRYAGYRLVKMPNPAGATDRLRAYLSGEIGALDALAVKTGGTPFQSAAWLALRRIPSGTTATYGEQAARIGRPAAVRAIGAANGQNPIALVLPCHRVIGADGGMTGYAGGLATKRWLLAHEAARS